MKSTFTTYDTRDIAERLDDAVSWWDRHKFYTGIAIGFALALLVACHPAYAQYADVPGGLKIDVPNHGVTVKIAVVPSGVGEGITILERTINTAGPWSGGGTIDPEFPQLSKATVDAAGGTVAYIQSKLPKINAALFKRYPPIGAPLPPAGSTPGQQVNHAFATYFTLSLDPNGAPVLSAR